MQPLDARLQVAAVVLSEELNFSRTAERLAISQPALSKQIAELENRVGFTIFKRDQRRVEMTEAGHVFVRGCKDALNMIEKAIRMARATQEEIQPIVTIGHGPYVDPVLVAACLGIHLPLYPTMRLRMESMFFGDLVRGILSAELDLAIITEPPQNPMLTIVPLLTAPIYVVLSVDHEASRKAEISFQDLGKADWLIFQRTANPSIYDRLIEAARVSGVAPVELHHYVAHQEAVQLLAGNFGIAFMSKGCAEQVRSPELVSRPLSCKLLEVSSSLVLRADQSSRLVNEFGRALLRKTVPSRRLEETSGQLLLGL
jgi:DNA-binding transcriptional LysR family regulator